MRTSLEHHPSAAELKAFAQGRLQPESMRSVEAHVTGCDSCCQQLAAVPDDTLMHLARAAATQGILSDETPSVAQPPKVDPREIPAELADHPRYHVLGLIGTGGMGAVYKAEHRLMERLVALKVISPALLANPKAVERFQREFKSAAKLSHPNIVAAHDADQAGELRFLVMEFVEGLSLDRLVAQNGRLPAAQACNLIRQAAQGLAHIHERGMIHRDIKPQNLMVTRKGQLKILDCGLARLASRDVDESTGSGPRPQRADATAEGMILGTPDYIAPEQITSARSADIRADVYSLGCTFYFLLTGQPPFPKGTVMDKLAAHTNRAPESVQTHRSDVSPEVVRVLERMLAKDPAQRYQTPAEVAKALAPLAKGQGSEPSAASQASGRREPPGGAALPLAPLPANDMLAALPAISTPVLSTHTLGPSTRSSRRHVASALAALNQLSPRVRLALAIAVPLAVLAIAVPLVGSFFSTPNLANPSQSNAPQSNSTVAGVMSAKNPSWSPAPAGPLPRRVLFIIPSHNLWYADYGPVKDKLEQYTTIQVDTASTSLDPSTLHVGSKPGTARPNVVLGSSVKAADYGAILFCGFNTSEYAPGTPAGEHVARLLRECDERGRFVGAICAGQRVLVDHQRLSGKRASFPPAIATEPNTSRSGAIWDYARPVTTDGRLITAATDKDANAFAMAIAAAMGK